MRVLAVDTTSERESVALGENGVVRAETRLRTGSRHSGSLLPAIAFVLESAGVPVGEVEGFAVVVGPGSFTGVRIGLSTIQGLALGASRPCLGVSTLDTLAATVRGEAATLVAMVDAARGDQVFAALYDSEGRRRGDPEAAGAADVAARIEGAAAFVGDGAERYRAEILAACPAAIFPARSLYLAGTLALIAEPRLARGEGVSPAVLRPTYLRAADIRRAAP
jgi:tRNA threonylcarbamoyladenosine biosynthesis protein TsaB